MATLMLTFYKYKWKRRRDIYSLFASYMKKEEVFDAIDAYDY